MTLEEGLYDLLTNNAGVAALVSTRIYPLVIPQDADLPAIAYQRISGPRLYAHTGPSGLAWARMQFSCRGATYSACSAVAEAVRATLSGYSGGAGSVEIESSLLDNEADSWGQSFEMPVKRLDFIIWYKEG